MVDVPENFSMNPEQLAQMQNRTNPLQKYMRQPAIYIKLPSNGEYWAMNSLEMTVNNELPVYPMSTKDEIAINTPDALMNGQAVVDMIHSCMPNIKNAWCIPVCDLDTILIAIRIASYGEKMEYTSICPECGNQDEYEIDLRNFLDLPVNLSAYQEPLEFKGMQIFLKPNDYDSVNTQNLEQFEQQRLVTMINDTELNEEDKQQRFYQIFKTMTDYTVKNVSGTILRIVTPEGDTVTDVDFIQEFVTNSERKLFEVVKAKIEDINKAIPAKEVNHTCDECGHKYTAPFTFDYSNFFASAS
tara:strand:+ start:157 stop:1056 length:900 start_codon:yes stop_codon:yes gene_type:complete